MQTMVLASLGRRFLAETSLVTTAAWLLVLAATPADAQCSFNHAARAKPLKASMVRYYTSCPQSNAVLYDYPIPDTSTASGLPACKAILPGYTLESVPYPPYALVVPTPYTFGPKGSCKLSMKPTVEESCGAGGTAPCTNLELKIKCKDIRAAMAPITNGEQWDLYMVVRVTSNDPVSGDMTMINFPLDFPFPADQPPGQLAMKTTSNDRFAELFGAGNSIFGACANIEVLTVAIRDPEDRRFATMGGSTY